MTVGICAQYTQVHLDPAVIAPRSSLSRRFPCSCDACVILWRYVSDTRTGRRISRTNRRSTKTPKTPCSDNTRCAFPLGHAKQYLAFSQARQLSPVSCQIPCLSRVRALVCLMLEPLCGFRVHLWPYDIHDKMLKAACHTLQETIGCPSYISMRCFSS